jgi:hypothetical protein
MVELKEGFPLGSMVAVAVERTDPMRSVPPLKLEVSDTDSAVPLMAPSAAHDEAAVALARPTVPWSLAGPPAAAAELDDWASLLASTLPAGELVPALGWAG